MNTKYLADGRKVCVVGKLNNEESIVQEIYINEHGDEIPAGERFVTKSLLDSPAITYKAKKEQELQKRIENIEADIKKKQAELFQYKGLLQANADILKSSSQLINTLGEKQAEILANFVTGNIKYLVEDTYKITPPKELFPELISWDTYYGEKKYDYIKLVSLLGKSNGDISYVINRYSDGSGSSTEVSPFLTYEDAITHIKERAEGKIKENRLDKEDMDMCLKLGIKFSKELYVIWLTNQKEKYIQSLASLQKSKEESNSRLKNHEDQIEYLEKELNLFKNA